jgi:hypothetical protein
MRRRTLTRGLILSGGFGGLLPAFSIARADGVSEGDAVHGIRAALDRGATIGTGSALLQKVFGSR